jgi:hypothetical protein
MGQIAPGIALSPTIKLRVGFYWRCAGRGLSNIGIAHAQSDTGQQFPLFQSAVGSIDLPQSVSGADPTHG